MPEDDIRAFSDISERLAGRVNAVDPLGSAGDVVADLGSSAATNGQATRSSAAASPPELRVGRTSQAGVPRSQLSEQLGFDLVTIQDHP